MERMMANPVPADSERDHKPLDVYRQRARRARARAERVASGLDVTKEEEIEIHLEAEQLHREHAEHMRRKGDLAAEVKANNRAEAARRRAEEARESSGG